MYLILRRKYVLRRRTNFFQHSRFFRDFNFISHSSQPWLCKFDALRPGRFLGLLVSLVVIACSFSGCSSESTGDPELTKNTYIELVDWHVSGLWVINCPVAWVRVANYNRVPIKEIQFKYTTYDYLGNKLNEGSYTIEGTVSPGGVKNFIELYIGLVDIHSERLDIELRSVESG